MKSAIIVMSIVTIALGLASISMSIYALQDEIGELVDCCKRKLRRRR